MAGVGLLGEYRRLSALQTAKLLWFAALMTTGVFVGPFLFAQDAVPIEILQRTLLIRVGNIQCTGFIIDRHGEEYLVTARHCLTGLSDTNPVIQVWQNNGWKDDRAVKAVFPSSRKVDIGLLDTGEKQKQPFDVSIVQGKEGPTYGQRVWFLGYPWGLGTQFASGEIPFIKTATFSASDHGDPQAVVLYFDGFNNPGFSGGPVVYWDFGAHAYRIVAVVEGYRNDTAKAWVNGREVDTNIIVNSGIVVTYSIKHAIDAIDEYQSHR